MTVKRPLTSWRNDSQKNQSWWCPIIQGLSRLKRMLQSTLQEQYSLSWTPMATDTPSPLKNPFPNRTKLWNLWSRTTGYYSSTWRMASLYSRICPYNNNPIRSQELDVLLRSQETKPTASTMVLIPIWIWCQAGPHTWKQNGSIRCTISATRSCYDFKRLRQSSAVVGSNVQVLMSLEECKSWTCIVLLGLRVRVQEEEMSIKD